MAKIQKDAEFLLLSDACHGPSGVELVLTSQLAQRSQAWRQLPLRGSLTLLQII